MNLTTSEIITAALALYGALLSTVVCVVQQLEKRQKIAVTLSLGFVAHRKNDPIDVVTLEAANLGNVLVHLSACHLYFPETKDKMVARFNFDKSFPITINSGESISAWLESEKFIEVVRKNRDTKEVAVIAEFSNKGRGKFRSKLQRFKLDEMLFAKQQAKNAT